MKELLLSILFISLLNLHSQAQTTAIPDTAFEAKLIQLGIDSDGLVNGLILDSDAGVVTNLVIDSSNISDLTGIAAFGNLELLHCFYNQLTSIDLSNNPNLDNLNCKDNQLTNLDLSNNTLLDDLNCENNLLTNLNVYNNTLLDELNCDNNLLDSIDVSNNTLLDELSCENNLLDSINVSNCLILKQLKLGNNQLTNLNVSNNTNLTRLVFDNNQLTNLNVSNSPNLEHLSCKNNLLTSIDLSSNTLLKNVYCENNLLTSINTLNHDSLIVFNFNDNQVTNIDISNSPNLEHLSCDNNLLTSLNLLNNDSLSHLSCSFNQLTNLDLSNNIFLERLSAIYNQLINLDLSNNALLTNVYCENNQLTSITPPNNSSLIQFNFDDNQITNIDISNSPNLTHFGCDRNLLTSLNISQNLSLSHLSCSFNQLKIINLSNNPNLVHLACGENQLSNIHLPNNSNLRNLYCDNNQLTNLELSNTSSLINLYCEYNYLNHINIKNNPILNFKSSDNLANLVICVNDSTTASTNPLWIKDLTARYTETCPNNTLIGDIKSDPNNNCKTDSLEPIVQSAIVQIISPTDTIYTTPNSSGKYAAELDPETYNLSITSPYLYLNSCNSTQSTSIDSINDLDTVNWALQATDYCPLLYASISAPYLRIAGGDNHYTINYCNHGTDAAYGAYIEVEIDSFLNVDSTELPIMSQVGNLYAFNLDTIDIGECGAFDIYVTIDTSAQIEQVHCSEVHIYPDSLCNSSWTGPIVEADGICVNDTIIFTLRNIGNPMINPRTYVVIEDNLVMFTNPFNLGSGANTTIKVVAQPGKSYRIQAEQANGFPSILGPPIAYANIQSCNGNNTNLNTVLQYYNGNTSPWIDRDCQANVVAYSPKLNTAQQIGYGNQHYIDQGTPLDYKIRFQNTGKDTNSHVTILDTISKHLDLSTLQVKAASHNYTWQIVNGRTLRVDFPNIQLVDSSVNELLSHGFFRYEIQQKPNLSLGTVINNQAAIYFDHNPPIFTNTTFHTIGENFIPTLPNIVIDESKILVYPNPTSGRICIKQLEAIDTKIKVIDNLGRLILQQNSNDKLTYINLNLFPQGIYYINIQQGHKMSAHKVVKY